MRKGAAEEYDFPQMLECLRRAAGLLPQHLFPQNGELQACKPAVGFMFLILCIKTSVLQAVRDCVL